MLNELDEYTKAVDRYIDHLKDENKRLRKEIVFLKTRKAKKQKLLQELSRSGGK